MINLAAAAIIAWWSAGLALIIWEWLVRPAIVRAWKGPEEVPAPPIPAKAGIIAVGELKILHDGGVWLGNDWILEKYGKVVSFGMNERGDRLVNGYTVRELIEISRRRDEFRYIRDPN